MQISGLSAGQRRYIAVEMVISCVVAVLFSAGFTLALFGGQQQVELWGRHGLAIDTVPHTLGILLPAVLVPTLITRRRVSNGKVDGLRSASAWVPRHLLLRTLLLATSGLAVFGGLLVVALELSKVSSLPFATVLVLKIVYGALVALAATPTIIRAALADATALPLSAQRY
jgi:hypothetical protein